MYCETLLKFLDEVIWKRRLTSEEVVLPITLSGIAINPEVLLLPLVCEKRMNDYIYAKHISDDYDPSDKEATKIINALLRQI